MKTSVVLSSYNGEKYIREQLQSILYQTRQVDEVLIFDDMSNDSTVAIVESFIIENGLNKTWRLYVNEVNKGWRRNFMDSFHKATGDIIFSCDQDDIWDKCKVAKMAACFEKDNRIELLSSNFTPFLDKGGQRVFLRNGLTHNKIGVDLNKKLEERASLNYFFLYTFVPGCTYAFRKSLLKYVDKVWYPEWAHDSVLSTVTKLRGTFYFLNEALLLYRRHEGTSTPKNVKTCSGRIVSAEDYLLRINSLERNARFLELKDDSIDKLKSVRQFLSAKIDFFSSKTDLKKVSNLFKYINYYPSIYSFAGDLYIRFIKGRIC